MKNAIILHGKQNEEEYYDPNYPSGSNDHWLPWLQKQLLVKGIEAHTPEVPNGWNPHYPTWLREFERYEITPETLLAGHSAGAGFMVRWLSQHPKVRVGKVVLVAPSLDPERGYTTDFFDFQIDPELATRTRGLLVFASDNDSTNVGKSIKLIRDTVKGARVREFHHYGHFTLTSMKTPKFPELLEELLA